jgi:hypothetical protein
VEDNMRRIKPTAFSIRLSILLPASALVVVGALAGCEPNPAKAITARAVSVSTGDADPSDPFGSCVIGNSGAAFFPLVCSHAGAACTGGDEGSTCNAGSCTAHVFHVMCDNPCVVDADCPVPLTGSARGSCHPDFHFCRLPCSGDSDCPTGSTCQDGTQWLARDSAGNSLGLCGMCMQTLTIQVGGDGGQ